jgi:hypothetical protein
MELLTPPSGNVSYWDRVLEALKIGIPPYGLISPPSSEVIKAETPTIDFPSTEEIKQSIENVGSELKQGMISVFDAIGQSAGAATQPLMNQVYIILIIAIVGLYFLSKSKIKFGV